MPYTLAYLRAELAKSIDGYKASLAEGGSLTEIWDTQYLGTGEFKSGHFNGAEVYIIKTMDDSAPMGQARYVTEFDANLGKLTVSKPFTATVDHADLYEIYLRCTVDELNQALMMAVKDWRWVDTCELTGELLEYKIDLPHLHRSEQIMSVWLRPIDSEDTPFREITDYRIWEDAGELMISFGHYSTVDEEMLLRIEYVAEYTLFNSISNRVFLDNAKVGGDLSLHLLRARKYYYERKMQGASGADREWYAQMVRYVVDELTERDGSRRRTSSRAKTTRWGSDASDDHPTPHQRYCH